MTKPVGVTLLCLAAARIALLLSCSSTTIAASGVPPDGGSGTTAVEDPRQDQIREFVDWASAHHVYMPRLQIRPWGPVGSGFEVVANSTITQGTAVFIVPREVAVRADSPHTDFKLRFAPSLLPGQPLHPDSISANRLEALTTQLAVLIVYERFYVPQSFWGPYWAMLPAEFPHIPTGEEGPRVRTLLQLSSALVVAVNEANRKSNLAVQTVLRAAAHHPEVFGELTPATTAHLQQQAKWAYAIAQTRCYNPRRTGDEVALVPLSDLLNHQQGQRGLGWIEQPESSPDTLSLFPISSYVQPADRTIATGESVLASYTTVNCNAHLLANYGFVEGPAGDCMLVHLDIKPGGVHRAEKRRVLEEAGLASRNAAVVTRLVRSATEYSTAPLVVSRLSAWSPSGEDFPVELAKQALKGPISCKVERLALASLQDTLHQYAASYLNSVRAAWANVTGEVEAGITVGTIADGVLQPPFLVGRSDMERKVLEVIYGHVRALLAYSRELTQHWVDFLHSDFQE